MYDSKFVVTVNLCYIYKTGLYEHMCNIFDCLYAYDFENGKYWRHIREILYV